MIHRRNINMRDFVVFAPQITIEDLATGLLTTVFVEKGYKVLCSFRGKETPTGTYFHAIGSKDQEGIDLDADLVLVAMGVYLVI